MAAAKFSKVLRGERGAEAKAKYLAYLTRLGPTFDESRIGTGGARPDAKILYLRPFSLDLPATVLVRASASVPAWDTVKGITAVSSRSKETIATGSQGLKLKGVKPARIIYRTLVDASGSKETSHLTGLTYLKYNNKSISIPFGKATDTETYSEAVAALIAGIPTTAKPRFQDEEA